MKIQKRELKAGNNIFRIDEAEFNFKDGYIQIGNNYGNRIKMPEIETARRLYKAIRDNRIDATHIAGAENFKTINVIKCYIKCSKLIDEVYEELRKRNIKLDFVEDTDIIHIVEKMKYRDMDEIIEAIKFKEDNDATDAMNDWIGN